MSLEIICFIVSIINGMAFIFYFIRYKYLIKTMFKISQNVVTVKGVEFIMRDGVDCYRITTSEDTIFYSDKKLEIHDLLKITTE